MLEKSDTDIPSTLAAFTAKKIDVAFLVPTRTGLEKAIMDATAPVRLLLAQAGLHDFDKQQQGPAHKKIFPAKILTADTTHDVSVSLYRPVTKNGDPRIWFSKLPRFASAHNLLALFVADGALHLVNCSRKPDVRALEDQATPLGRIAAHMLGVIEPIALELLNLMKLVAKKGYLTTVRAGDTGVGATLEHHLGISANTSKAPDYKGIEIKASRNRPTGRRNRVTLFSQVPNWSLSPVGSAIALLNTYGYRKDGRLQLYHEMNAVKPNSIGFQLSIDSPNDWLRQNHVKTKTTHVATWEFDTLRSRLLEKHPQTFWVKADCKGVGKAECFQFSEIVHTRQPRATSLETLIEAGSVTLDYTMSLKGTRVRDHGYLFKIHPEDFSALFPPPQVYKLI